MLTDELTARVGRPLSLNLDGDDLLAFEVDGQPAKVDTDLKAVVAVHDSKKTRPESESVRAEREVNEMLAPLLAKAKSIQGGSTTVSFTAREMQTILAAVVLRPRNTPGGRP